MIELNENERIEDLQCEGLRIIQNKNLYTFTSDSVVLANFVKLKKREVAVEIGSGSGVIAILLSQKQKNKHIYAFELQKELFDMSLKSIELNQIDNITVYNDKVQNHMKYIENGSVDVVFTNPPYKREGSAELNKNSSRAIARHESNLPLKDLIKSANDMLKFGGRFYAVYDADRCCELIYELMLNKIEPKRMFFTQNGQGKNILFVVEAVKGGKHGVIVLPPLITNDKEGNYIHDIQKIRQKH